MKLFKGNLDAAVGILGISCGLADGGGKFAGRRMATDKASASPTAVRQSGRGGRGSVERLKTGTSLGPLTFLILVATVAEKYPKRTLERLNHPKPGCSSPLACGLGGDFPGLGILHQHGQVTLPPC